VSFFNSDIVQQELKEIGFLQERVSSNILSFYSMSKEEKLNHIRALEDLLEKQRVLYTRLSLSNDPKAIEMKNKLDKTIKILDTSSCSDINSIFKNMIELIDQAKRQLRDY
jgi:coenzyme F420-reducing hydrogenase delta subunit